MINVASFPHRLKSAQMESSIKNEPVFYECAELVEG